jgi:hypothetical protein
MSESKKKEDEKKKQKDKDFSDDKTTELTIEETAPE